MAQTYHLIHLTQDLFIIHRSGGHLGNRIGDDTKALTARSGTRTCLESNPNKVAEYFLSWESGSGTQRRRQLQPSCIIHSEGILGVRRSVCSTICA
jgi:hypothetical protein